MRLIKLLCLFFDYKSITTGKVRNKNGNSENTNTKTSYHFNHGPPLQAIKKRAYQRHIHAPFIFSFHRTNGDLLLNGGNDVYININLRNERQPRQILHGRKDTPDQYAEIEVQTVDQQFP